MTAPGGTTAAPELVAVSTGVRLACRRAGSGEPLLLIMGAWASMGLWAPVEPALAERHATIAYDHRGIGASERGQGAIGMAALADDAAALLEALGVGRAHVLGYSLGSCVAQELALRHPERVGSLVLYATWARRDRFQTAVLTAIRSPWRHGEVDEGLTVLGLSFSPEFLNSEGFEATMGWARPLLPDTPDKIAAATEQLRADLDHDTVDRLGAIAAPTLVVGGEQDLLTPPWLCEAVARAIPGAEYRLLRGPGSSHALMIERPADFREVVLGFLAAHPLG